MSEPSSQPSPIAALTAWPGVEQVLVFDGSGVPITGHAETASSGGQRPPLQTTVLLQAASAAAIEAGRASGSGVPSHVLLAGPGGGWLLWFLAPEITLAIRFSSAASVGALKVIAAEIAAKWRPHRAAPAQLIRPQSAPSPISNWSEIEPDPALDPFATALEVMPDSV